jgi:Kdo2-lipid IVA lauroyltransferase/acyltransferase
MMNLGKARATTKTRKTFRHVLEYIAALIFYALLRLLPSGLRLKLAGLFGYISYLVTPRRVKIALENLHAAFPNLPASDRKRIVQQVYRNLAANAIEEISPARAAATVAVDAQTEARLAHLQQQHEQGRALLFVTGHYGNWEVLAQFMTTRLGNISFLAKEQSNPYINKMITRLRSAMGGQVIPTNIAARLAPKVLKSGGILLLAADQDAGSGGVMIEFLGRPAAYFRGWALFSYHYHAPVAFMFLKRESQGFTLEIADIVEPDLTVDKDVEIKRLLTHFSDHLAAAVTAHPEQWLWTHRRWKSGIPLPRSN